MQPFGMGIEWSRDPSEMINDMFADLSQSTEEDLAQTLAANARAKGLTEVAEGAAVVEGDDGSGMIDARRIEARANEILASGEGQAD